MISNYALPKELGEYKQNSIEDGVFSRIVYTKDNSFVFPKIFKHHELESTEFKEYLQEFTRNVKYEVEGPAKIVSDKMKEKLFLNDKINSEFENILSFININPVDLGDSFRLFKHYEIYAIIDYNSNTIYFACVTIFPNIDAPLILKHINELRKEITKNGILPGLEALDWNSKSLVVTNKLHLFSFSANKYIKEIRHVFGKDDWMIKLLDEEYFSKKVAQYEKGREEIILCEGKNKTMLNLLKLPNTIFSDEHNSVTIFQNVKSMKIRCLRDKDFLTTEEVTKLKRKLPKYHILDYYCIENYLYHPENIFEFLNGDFNKDEYIEDIIHVKNNKLEKTIKNIATSRLSYLELSENHINPSKDAEIIISDELRSDKFWIFYKHFDMKKYNKSFLNKYNLSDNKLATTEWFKSEILSIIS
jgi:hypothetical protein